MSQIRPWAGLTPQTEHFPEWYGVKAHWHKIPKYLVLGLAVLWILGS